MYNTNKTKIKVSVTQIRQKKIKISETMRRIRRQ